MPVARTPVKRKPVKRTPAKPLGGGSSVAAFDGIGSIVPPYIDLEGLSSLGIDPNSVDEQHVEALCSTQLALWAAVSGVKVDHRPFDFERHRYLIPLYMDDSQEVVLMKSAQMGATIWVLLKVLHFCIHHQVKACFFFPTQDGVNLLSKDRMTPLISSNPQLQEAVKETDTLGYKKVGESSSLYLRHLGGVASKDSTPFDMIAFDEVRLLDAGDISQARERVSHSDHKRVVQVSTAGYPNADVHKQYLIGTQNEWHSKCGCPDGVILSDVFPDCIALPEGKEPYYRCPRCGMRLPNPQNGQFIPHNPGADVQSYHIHQMLSRFITAKEIWDAFQTTDNLKEFYNGKMGVPYVDSENIPVDEDDLIACENTDILWKPSRGHVGMGVDQMSGVNYVIIAKRTAHKKRILHYEIIDNRNPAYFENGKPVTPFKRLYQLMREYSVDMCIIDAMPNANEAMDLARAFPKKVFVAWYIEQAKEIAQWGDRIKWKTSVKRGGPKIKFKYSVMLSRYLSIELSMGEIGNHHVEWPDPRTLVQVVRSPKTGRFGPHHIMLSHFYRHMQSIVKQKTPIDVDLGKYKMEWVNLGLDPHTVHAWNYCNIALERLKSQPMFTF